MRHNIFNHIHHQFKVELLNTCLELDNQDKFDLKETSAAINKVVKVLRLYKDLVSYEASYLLPLIFEYEPSIWDCYTREHHKGMNQLREIEVLVKTFRASKRKEEKSTIVEFLRWAFNDFMIQNYNHMDDEEEVLNEILWRYYPDKTILEAQDKMVFSPAAYEVELEIFETAVAA